MFQRIYINGRGVQAKSPVMFDRSLRHADHVRRFSISFQGTDGWEVRREDDLALTRHNVYLDWHRVERALALFEQEVSELRQQGWRDS